MQDDARRMLQEARSRLNDAEILAGSLAAQSDSSALLRILGFEILLKCATLLCGIAPKRTHSYRHLWTSLPHAARNEILVLAKDRMPGHADLSDPDKVLNAWQLIFEKGRYFYEFYYGWTVAQQREYGELWESLGAPTEEADLQYYPNELSCFIEALTQFIERRLSE
jgi:hypothetical protein